jgi:acyl carrier protein
LPFLLSPNREYSVSPVQIMPPKIEVFGATRDGIKASAYCTVGRNDSFFGLGGHSLHGLALISRIAERFKIDVPVSAVFQYPTVAEMSAAVNSLREGPETGETSRRVQPGRQPQSSAAAP